MVEAPKFSKGDKFTYSKSSKSRANTKQNKNTLYTYYGQTGETTNKKESETS